MSEPNALATVIVHDGQASIDTIKPALEILAAVLRDANLSGEIHFEGKKLKFFPGDGLSWG